MTKMLLNTQAYCITGEIKNADIHVYMQTTAIGRNIMAIDSGKGIPTCTRHFLNVTVTIISTMIRYHHPKARLILCFVGKQPTRTQVVSVVLWVSYQSLLDFIFGMRSGAHPTNYPLQQWASLTLPKLESEHGDSSLTSRRNHHISQNATD